MQTEHLDELADSLVAFITLLERGQRRAVAMRYEQHFGKLAGSE